MRLTPHEQERLLLSYAAELARRRQARGLQTQPSRGRRVITDHILEGARDGRSVAELMVSGREVLARDDVMEGVPEMLARRPGGGDFPGRHQARHRPPPDPVMAMRTPMMPGEIVFGEGDIEINPGAPRLGWTSSTPATGRCRSAATCTCRRPTPRWSSTARPRTATGSTSRQAPRCGSNPVWRRRVSLVPLGGTREVHGLSLHPPGRVGRPSMTEPVRLSRAVRRAVRPDHRRPDPAGRHRSVRRDHRGPQRRTGTRRRRGGLRRRQGAARVDGAGAAPPAPTAHPTP